MSIKKSLLLMGLTTFGAIPFISSAESNSHHGYIDSPPSRALLCSTRISLNKNCGPIMYEPQSVEGPKGFPQGGPPDGKIASAGISQFNQLNEQGANRWHHVTINKGINDFKWTLTARHSTTSWQFFITKPDWDPNKPLTRAQFDLNPFCEHFDNGKQPAQNVSLTCNVPERSGYHVILGVWTISDTNNAFYQVIDVDIK
ncbi:lytic polysaccharide monooxygenase [Xenorhabdus nematophila]|uniref:Chitin-binding protein(CBP21) n=1 Tax=Xenorhabdus nematophila (strain ATCC 19061 / DSM 3370 / CCUG 14189 / LMG 1036 / NCIMB 9965 / AN6) TaxID=406817 RepID=D3VJZ2_XENNA|nr:lytic polysaccharide monooxygenase [Xenorhabdus nematophila]CEE95293.1 Chitin-binding protein(CBP21 precursor) [Xenorhabdus nematophila str. Anatoliense]CEF28511.1 Chitin-binding protein(CBP21 precursor) [Xenorhabdus nematophila str. Websteri]AYA39130.1 chitin-binding protein [Xenorhabdus nematophila]MBA0017714.1 lytic polysaccharide monooxygenase [Xenorhabdus nematophila]MCB4427018.1 chitin-binding protein [Xenorhabdus nematophila]